MTKITFAYNNAIEAISSASRYANLAEYQKQLKGFGAKSSPEMTEWLDMVKSQISEYLEEELKALFSDTHMNTLFMQQMIVQQGIESMTKLVQALKGYTAEEYLGFIYEYLQLDKNAEASAVKAAVLDTHSRKCAENVLELIRNPQETLERLAFTVRKFCNSFFEPVYLEVEEIIEEKIRYFEAKYNEAPERFFQRIIGTKLFEFRKDCEIRIFVSHFHEASLCLLSNNDPEKRLYSAIMGYQIESILSEDAINKKKSEAFKILSDEKRIQILKLICRKKYYGNELAKELKITTATLSYHISKLFELGVMNIEEGEANRVYYHADKEKLRRLMDNIYSEITGEELNNEN